MNIVILDNSIKKSASLLSDFYLNDQIESITDIIMTVYNKKINDKIESDIHEEYIYRNYSNDNVIKELVCYLFQLCSEFCLRFGIEHEKIFWVLGFKSNVDFLKEINFDNYTSFIHTKSYIDNIIIDDIEISRRYLLNKKDVSNVWTNRDKPKWWC